MLSTYRTTVLLAFMNACAMSASPLMMLIGSIVGAQLAPHERWATLPIALMVVGTACGVVPAARSMEKFGRRTTFAGFIVFGASACLMAGQALKADSFTLFCLCATALGFTNAALQQVRFAAMESVSLDRAPTAASIIMCAGIVSAFVGPELALLGRGLSAVEYQGSFWLAALCLLAGGLLLPFYRGMPRTSVEAGAPVRALPVILANRQLQLAVASAAVAFVVMSFIMTATPISMHLHEGHSMADTKWVIQSHIAAMFLPSLFTVWLFRLLSIRGLMIAGLACFFMTISIGLIDSTVLGFWGQLVMLGIGWNFLFVAGTALLPSTYGEGEQFRVQALNDSVIFSSQAVASLLAGWALAVLSWESLLLACLMPIILLLVLWWRARACV